MPHEPDRDKWLELWAICRFDLGLSQEEFGLLTMPQYEALVKRWKLAEERKARRVARLCATIANSAPFRKGRAMREEDFLPLEFRSYDSDTPGLLFQKLRAYNAKIEAQGNGN